MSSREHTLPSNSLSAADGATLLDRVQSWKSRSLSEKKKDFSVFLKSIPINNLSDTLSQLETLYAEGHLSTSDFCMVIRMASYMPFSVHILRSRLEPQILFAAVQVFRTHWHKGAMLEILLTECRTAEGLVEIIASLPVSIAIKLIRIIGARGQLDKDSNADVQLRTQTVDFIIRAAIPFLNPESNAHSPIRRMALILLRHIIPVASESLLRALIPRVERYIPARTWKVLAIRHPLLMSQLVFLQLGKRSSETWANDGILKSPQNLLPAILALDNTKKADNNFLWKCLAEYASYIQGRSELSHGDILGLHPDRLSKLTSKGFTARILKEGRKEKRDIQCSLEVLDILSILHAAEGKHDWEWNHISPVLDCALAQFARRREEWVSPQDSQQFPLETERPTATTVLHAIFKRFKNSKSLLDLPTVFLDSLRKYPAEAQGVFWSIAYFSRFTMEITHSNITLPRLSPFLVYVLGRTRGEEVFRRGVEAHGSTFLSSFDFPQSHRDLDLLSSSFNMTLPSKVGEEHSIDAQLAVLHAAWLCSDVKRWDDVQDALFKTYLEDVQRDVSKFKALASRARTGEERLAFLKVIFAIIFPTHQLDLLDDALAWAGKRFVRDPEAGIGLWNWLLRGEGMWSARHEQMLLTVVSSPLVKKPHKDEQLSSYVENLRKYFDGAGKVLRTLRDFLDSLNKQQGNALRKSMLWETYRYGGLLEEVIQERTNLLSEFPDSLTKRKDLCAAVFEDLSPLILSHGEMGRRETYPVPSYIGNLDLLVPSRLWDTVIPWIDGLGAKVEDLYRAAFESGETTGLPDRQQTFWPVQASLTNDLKQKILYLGEADFGISSTHYYRHIESWLFTTHSTLLQVSDGKRGFDRYHMDQRLPRYVEDYLTFSRSQDEVSRKIERLLSHYGPVGTSSDADADDSWGDHSLIILHIPRVREQLKRSPHLSTALLDRLLPQYPPSERPTEIVRYDPLAHMPGVPSVAQTSVLGYAVIAPTETDRLSIFQSLLQDTISPKNTCISPHHMERVAFLTVSHISTFYQIPALHDLEGHGPISDALRYFRLTTTQAFDSGKDDPSVERLLERTLPYIASSEIKKLISVIIALPLTERTCESTLALLDVLSRHYEPGIVADLSFYVLTDAESSSWHRHTKIRSLLRASRPTNALSIMKRFLNLLAANKREQLQLRVQAEEMDDLGQVKRDAEEDQHDKKASLKITTIKMFLELLNKGIQDGIFSEDTCDLAFKIMEISSHPSVSEEVIDFLVQIICTQDITSISTTSTVSQTDRLWSHLRSFVRIGARLAESVGITEATWDATTRGDASMPIVETPHFIASTLLEVNLEQFSPHTRELWIEDVLVPLLCGHVSNRTRWLKVALSREGGSGEDISQIYGSFDDKFNVALCLGQTLYRSQQVPKRCIEALFPILEKRLRVPLSRSPFEILLQLTQGKHRTDKNAQTYLKDVRLLTAHALGNDTNAFSSTLSNVVYGIKLPSTQPEVIAALVEIVERTGESLLAPENISVKYDSKGRTHAFACFLGMLPTLSPSKADSQWYTRIRPILESFLTRAESLEREQSKALYNSGACYWSVIISLKVLLLPLPGIAPYKDAEDRADKYAQALADLAKDILRYPGHHRLIADSFLTRVTSNAYCNFVDVLPICRALTSSSRAKTDAPELRLLCFEIAIGLICTFSAEFKDNTEERASKEEMVSVWSNDSDGTVRWMTLQSTP